jgi:hypothetical protein
MAKLVGVYEVVNGKRVLLRCEWECCIAPSVSIVTVKGVTASLCAAHAIEARKTGGLILRHRR